MPYIVYKSDGTILVNISDSDVDQETTSLDLIGKNVNNYGEIYNNNLVRLLTSFASHDAPRNPQIGQLWFSLNQNTLRVYDGSNFIPVYGSQVSGSPPNNPSEGDFWFDSTNNQFFVYNGSWKIVGPPVSSTLGKFGIFPPDSASIYITDHPTNNARPVGLLYSNGYAIGIVTTTTFNVSTSSSQQYFNTTSSVTLYDGITLLDNLEVKKDTRINGDLYLNGQILLSPNKTLSAFYNIVDYGNPEAEFVGTLTDTATRLNSLITGNNAIRADLKKLFPIASTSTFNTTGYVANSEVRVLCRFTDTSTSVRRFKLTDNVPGIFAWEPVNIYPNVLVGTMTNIVANPDIPVPVFSSSANWSPSLFSISSSTNSATLSWNVTNAVAVNVKVQGTSTLWNYGLLSTGTYIINWTTSTQGNYTATVIAYNQIGDTATSQVVLTVNP